VTGGDARVTRAAAAAFGLRLGAGVLLTGLLPVIGYADNEVHQAGYVFFDAYNRDQEAWDLASGDTPLWSAFRGEYTSDQYGGLLALSAAVYRYLSPEAHRPLLVLSLAATASALGVFFLWRAARDWFGDTVALTAGWIFAIYPEAVLLGSSQMREPFILWGIAMAFYGLSRIQSGRIRPPGWLILATVILFFTSPPAALAALGVLFGVWLFEPGSRWSWRQGGVFLGVIALGVLAVIGIFSQYPSLERAGPWRVLLEWFQYNFGFQAHLLERSSGWVQKLFRDTGEAFQPLIVVVYGLTRPVLPAALVVPGIGIMRVIGIIRALGWYTLAPLLVFGTLSALRYRDTNRRRQLLWLSLAVWIAVFGAALIAGGDQWDNPRYRTWLLPWAALLAGWAWNLARTHRDPWLRRIVLVEGLFVLLFTEWYLSRYFPVVGRLNFWVMVGVIVVGSALILVGGWLRDRQAGQKPANSGEDPAPGPDPTS
jgi:hypothetical protein